MKTISNKTLAISVDPYGAELTSITSDGKEYLWQGDPAFWKRHSPILFPIVGGLWDGKYRHEGRQYQLPQHGFARDNDFDLVYESDSELRFRFTENDETLKVYPFRFSLEIGYKLSDNKVIVSWKVSNRGDKPMHFQIGAHPAFNYPDFDANAVQHGYFAFGGKNALDYILIKEKGCVDKDSDYRLGLDKDGLLPIGRQLFDNDALIFENSQLTEVSLLDANRQPQVTLRFNAPLVGLWSPPHKYDCPFVCIEPWYGRCDSVGYNGEFKDRDWVNELQPDGVFETAYTIEIG